MHEPTASSFDRARRASARAPRAAHSRRIDGIILAAMAVWSLAFVWTLHQPPAPREWSGLEWFVMAIAHLPFLAILSFLFIGFLERFDYFRVASRPPGPGVLPAQLPLVCVQLPMFNEDAVAERVIAAAAALDWPPEALEIQVLDDSTDEQIKARVRRFCEALARERGIALRWIHRVDRKGYKAGALEAGRKASAAEFFAIFDADFVPHPDFLQRAIPHFYDDEGQPVADRAVVQAQWGHLNDRESFLTRAQALWVDDHHTIQKTWRSAAIGFVNFTGTAGVWRAQAIEDAGGWRAASLVEDCELSVRALLAGYHTRFVGGIVAPAELPQTVAAYRSQQKRWTQGWAQLQRLHMGTLLWRYPTPPGRRLYLLYLAGISWQWFFWTLWIMIMPFLIANGLWLGHLGTGFVIGVYVAPPLFFAAFAALVASNEARSTYHPANHAAPATRGMRFARVFPYMVVNTGMMPHHFCAFIEGMLGPLHSEFVRTPKTASTGAVAPGSAAAPSRPRAGVIKDLPYLKFELFFCMTLAIWTVYFVVHDLIFAAFWSIWIFGCIVGLRLAPALLRAFPKKSLADAV